jgi:hypothetical protein
MSEAELEAALFPADPHYGGQASKGREPTANRALPDFARIHEELQQYKHTTRQLLWEEYRAAHPDRLGWRDHPPLRSSTTTSSSSATSTACPIRWREL